MLLLMVSTKHWLAVALKHPEPLSMTSFTHDKSFVDRVAGAGSGVMTVKRVMSLMIESFMTGDGNVACRLTVAIRVSKRMPMTCSTLAKSLPNIKSSEEEGVNEGGGDEVDDADEERRDGTADVDAATSLPIITLS